MEKYVRTRRATNNHKIQQTKEAICMLGNQGKSTDALLIFVIANNSIKYFLDRHQCEGNPLFNFMATLKTLILFTST